MAAVGEERSRHAKEAGRSRPQNESPRRQLASRATRPSQALEWAVEALAKAGTLSIIGVYPQTARFFPIGMAMNKNLTVNMGNCPHRNYLPMLVDMVRNGAIDPTNVLKEEVEPMSSVIEAYKAFDQPQAGLDQGGTEAGRGGGVAITQPSEARARGKVPDPIPRLALRVGKDTLYR